METYHNDGLKLGPVLDGKVTGGENVDAVVLDATFMREADGVRALVPFSDTESDFEVKLRKQKRGQSSMQSSCPAAVSDFCW